MKKKVISIILVILMLGANLVSYAQAENGDTASLTSYEELFEKDKIIDIYIDIAEKDLQDIYAYPKNEEYHSADITVNGIKVENAGIRTKGNMTLSSVASSDSDRYSFRIKFNKYVKGQKLLGLDELCLNNCYSDPSYMREYLHYEMVREMGMEVSETAFCNVYINGELYGFYLAVEALDESFVETTYGENGNLYKMEEGASLVYKEDENYTYSDLKSGPDKDLTSFKEFVKNLNDVQSGEKGNIESFLDVDSALIYIAANTVLCNYDSYNNSMKHNYYLYENEAGIFSVIPWDMNMSFGGRESNTDVGIDTPLVSGTMEDSPLISKLLAVDEYKEKYYGYIKEMMAWLEKLEDRVAELKAQIKPYVESDPSAFYTIEEFERATTLQTTAEETTKNETEGSSTENKENRRGGGFGNGKSIINVALERLENLKAQFDGTAEKSTLSGQTGGGFGGGFPGGFGGGVPGGNFDGQMPEFDGQMPEFNGEDRPARPENFNLGEFKPQDGNRPEDGFGDMFGRPSKNNPSQENSVIRVHVDGHILTFDTNPVIENDTTLVGFRSILEELGATVEWNEETRTVTAVKDDIEIILTIGSNVAYVNGESVELLAAPAIMENSTMIPVRFISEQLGMKVAWNGDTKLITITSK